MIARRDPDGGWVLIRQHDHGLLSGLFATRWQHRHVPGPEARFAVAHHDVAWLGLDARPRLRDDGAPYTFIDHPLGPKYHAYRAGIDLAEDADPYAGWLCSRHYGRFAAMLDDELSVRFVEDEAARRERLWSQVPPALQAQGELDVALLVFCDNLSLFLCLNAPGEDSWPWFRGGLRFDGEPVQLRWRDDRHLELDPFPFDAPLGITLDTYDLGSGASLVPDRAITVELVAP